MDVCMYYTSVLKADMKAAGLTDAQVNAIIMKGKSRPDNDIAVIFTRVGKPTIPVQADGGSDIYFYNTVASDDQPIIKIELKDAVGNKITRQINAKIPPRLG